VTGGHFWKQGPGLQPDIVVLYIAMPQLNGLDAGRQLKQAWPQIKLIYMTMYEDPELVGESFCAGGSAFLLKEAAVSELTEATDKVLKGGSYVTPSAAEGLTNISLRAPKAREHAPEPTPRQREVLQLLAEGRSMKEVAFELHITRRTVGCHKVCSNGTLKPEVQLRACAVRHPAQDHCNLASNNFPPYCSFCR
jgi:DNA-binding NarL/FixJ family response regulator